MLRFFLTLAYPIFLTPLYLEWSRRQTEGQIDKMQSAAFNTPGTEAPVPALVIVGGVALLVGYWLLTRLFGLQGWVRALGVLLGVPVGVAIFTQRLAGRE
jgi:hypothetical protein